jgi:hypothetical protein
MIQQADIQALKLLYIINSFGAKSTYLQFL